MFSFSIKNLIRIGHWEGISYLILLFIAMPIKYFFNDPNVVRYVGMAHGVLFVLFMLWIAIVFFQRKIKFVHALVLFLLSLVPFGTFYIETYLKRKKVL